MRMNASFHLELLAAAGAYINTIDGPSFDGRNVHLVLVTKYQSCTGHSAGAVVLTVSRRRLARELFREWRQVERRRPARLAKAA